MEKFKTRLNWHNIIKIMLLVGSQFAVFFLLEWVVPETQIYKDIIAYGSSSVYFILSSIILVLTIYKKHKKELDASAELCRKSFRIPDSIKESKEVIKASCKDFTEYYSRPTKWYEDGLYEYTKAQTALFDKEDFGAKYFELYPQAMSYYCGSQNKSATLGFWKIESLVNKYSSNGAHNLRELDQSLSNKENEINEYLALKKEYSDLWNIVGTKYINLFTYHQRAIFLCFSAVGISGYHKIGREILMDKEDIEVWSRTQPTKSFRSPTRLHIGTLLKTRSGFRQIINGWLKKLDDYKKKESSVYNMKSSCPFGVEKYLIEHTNSDGLITFASEYQEEIRSYEDNKIEIIKQQLKEDERLMTVQRKEKVKEIIRLIKVEREKREKLENEKRIKADYQSKLAEYERDKKQFEEQLRQQTNLRLFGGDRYINGIPHNYLFYYYPDNRIFSPPHSERTSGIIYSFKRGVIDVDTISKLNWIIRKDIGKPIYQYIEKNAPKKPLLNEKEWKIDDEIETDHFYDLWRKTPGIIPQYSFVCIPSSTQSSYLSRCRNLSKELCQQLVITNGFEPSENNFPIKIRTTNTPKHLGGDGSIDKYYVDKPFFQGKHLIVFDDIVTSGDTMRTWINRFQSWGATVDLIVSLGYTYEDSLGEVEDPVKFQ